MSDAKYKAGDVLVTEYGDTIEMLVFVSGHEAMRSEFPSEHAANIEKALADYRRSKEAACILKVSAEQAVLRGEEGK